MNIDAEFTLWLAGIRSPALDAFMLLVTSLVSYFVIFFFLLLLLTAGRRKLVIALLVGLALDFAISGGLKLLLMRPRPYEVLPVGSIAEDFSSFPSSHASRSFVIAGILSRNYRKIRLFLYAGACLIAFSRVYLGVHYLSDVLFGSAVGILISVAVLRLGVLRRLVDRLDALVRHKRPGRAKKRARI
jgi:undecaprenyl-diphosphatase